MAANVRCAGLPFEQLAGGHSAQAVPPCGWRGERFPRINLAGTRGTTLSELRALEDVARVAKLCPRCGGHVELIPVPASPPE
jgi:hypothetical protein